MKWIIFFSLFISAFSAQAAAYSCFAVANADRGFPQDLQIQVAEVAPGGEAILRTGGQSYPMPPVFKVNTFVAPGELDVLVYFVGMYGEKDVSGVSPEDLEKINKVEIITLKDDAGPQILNYFIDDKQVGGTLAMDLHATACLPLSTP